VRTDAGAQRSLDAVYVTEYLQHAYALTAHTIQGGTVEWAGVVGHPDDFTRNWSYTALSRAREPTELFVIGAPTERELERAEVAPNQPAELGDQRTPVGRLDAAMRRRDDEELALDRIDRIATRPPSDRTHTPPSRGTMHDLSLDMTFTAGDYACRPPREVHGPWVSRAGREMFEVRYAQPR
jgi:hypothetical protein